METDIKRDVILKRIFECLSSVIQWSEIPEWFDSASKYLVRAENLIEILEVDDCGSVGGFDLKNQPRKVSNSNIINRAICVADKYKSPVRSFFSDDGSFDDFVKFYKVDATKIY